MQDDVAARLEAAAEAAVLGGRLAQAVRVQGLEVKEKGLQDFVTQADRAVEVKVRALLAERFPDDGFLGEEDGYHPGKDGVWTVDPIDGTANFAAGLPLWGISIGWVRDGRLEVGAVYAPDFGNLYTARAGHGAYLNGRRMPALTPRPASRSIINLGRSPKVSGPEHARLISGLLEAGYEYRRLGSAALSLALVAAGSVQAFGEIKINSWDVLGGVCVARETGAWCSDFLAGDGLLKGNPILVAAPGLAADLLPRLGLAHLEEMPAPR